MASQPKSSTKGLWAERRALIALERHGWRLLAQQWRCRWGEIDLLLAKPDRLLLVEVKGRSRCGPDGWGVAACDGRKRLRIRRGFGCWLLENPQWQAASVQMVLALVPLPPLRARVRWLTLDG
ncbi:MAG: hypothetical protein RLZZ158_356 [Cyanobacteriota bacterium]|jgi:putative endonuclease